MTSTTHLEPLGEAAPESLLTRRGLFGLGAGALMTAPLLGRPSRSLAHLLTPAERHHAAADRAALTFPRTGTCFLEHQNLPSADLLGRYDLVVISAEWIDRVPRRFFDELRSGNPRLTLLPYVNLVDTLFDPGPVDDWQYTRSLWQIDADGAVRFPAEWLAHTADGTPVHEWLDQVMTNLTDQAPLVDGVRFAEYAARWVVDHIGNDATWNGGIWDGAFLDVWGDRIYTADQPGWDVDRDGVDELDDEIYGAGGPLDRGLRIAEDIMREGMPDAVLVANGDRVARGAGLDGLVFENFADPLDGREASFDLRRYLASFANSGLRQPSTTLTINSSGGLALDSPDALRRARWFLTMTLLGDGYWLPVGRDYGQLAYYDELDGAGLGRGYLGLPLQPPQTLNELERSIGTAGTGSPGPGVLRRDFDHGIALVNVGDTEQHVTLETTFRRLRGAQDPVVNDGSDVDAVVVPASDGIVLLRK